MKKRSRDIELFEISQTEHKNIKADKIKTTDVNVLLNRVKLTEKIELKKKILYFSLLLLVVGLVGIFSLI